MKELNNSDASMTEQKNGQIEKTKAAISEEALKERQLLSTLLIQGADTLAEVEARKRKLQTEEIELLSGKKITINGILQMVTASRQPYAPMFGNDKDFFREMYRLLKWTDKDPNQFTKPEIVGKYLNQIIYARFPKDVQPALYALAIPGGFRLDKLFQYLTAEGLQKLQQYRDEAIAMMKTCTTWYEFQVKYGKLYGLPVQKKMFEEFQSDES